MFSSSTMNTIRQIQFDEDESWKHCANASTYFFLNYLMIFSFIDAQASQLTVCETNFTKKSSVDSCVLCHLITVLIKQRDWNANIEIF